MTTFYDILKVAPNAENATIKKAYYLLALEHHPDKCKDKDEKSLNEAKVKFQKIVEAYETLSDPKKRTVYDRSIVVEAKRESNAHQKRPAPAPEQPQQPKKTSSTPDPRPHYRFVPPNIPAHAYEFTIHQDIEDAYYYYWTLERSFFVTKAPYYYAGDLGQLLKEIKELSQNRRDKQGNKFSDIDLQYWTIKKSARGKEYISIPTNKPRCIQFDLRIIRKTLNVHTLHGDSQKYNELKAQDPLHGEPRFDRSEEVNNEAPNASFNFNYKSPLYGQANNPTPNFFRPRPFDFYNFASQPEEYSNNSAENAP